jgi:hypothetical protein
MDRMRSVVMVALAGCCAPVPPEGAPCQTSNDCPTPQRCVLGACSLHDAPAVDAGFTSRPDAPPDAPLPSVDAVSLACTTDGLSCGGTAATFTCGGHCWVLCTGHAAYTAAQSACTGWMGALGEIDDATEQSCVASHVNNNAWLGLQQTAGATSPGAGWTWNGTTALAYTHWQSGVPNDQDGNENGDEQCAKIQTDGTWDDVACSSSIEFFCERG